MHYIGPLSSIGSPITFIIRPNVSGPTGIVIGPPKYYIIKLIIYHFKLKNQYP